MGIFLFNPIPAAREAFPDPFDLLLSASPGNGDSAASAFHSNFHVHSSRHFLLSGPLRQRHRVPRDALSSAVQSPLTPVFHSQTNPAPAPQELHTKFLMGSPWLPQPWFQYPLSNETASKNALETLLGVWGWECCPEGTQDVEPIHDPGFLQEAPAPGAAAVQHHEGHRGQK